MKEGDLIRIRVKQGWLHMKLDTIDTVGLHGTVPDYVSGLRFLLRWEDIRCIKVVHKWSWL